MSTGKARLAPAGFYIKYIVSSDGAVNPDLIDVIHIKDNLTCAYNRGGGWCTLLWTCAPTKKQLTNSPMKYDDFTQPLVRFDTLQELLDSAVGKHVKYWDFSSGS